MDKGLDLQVGVEYTDVEATGEVEFRFSLAHASVTVRSERNADGAGDLSLLVSNLYDIWAQALDTLESEHEDVR